MQPFSSESHEGPLVLAGINLNALNFKAWKMNHTQGPDMD